MILSADRCMWLDAVNLTAEWAWRSSPYYREVFASAPQFESLDDFRNRTPVIAKDLVSDRPDDFLDLDVVPTGFSITSGTTSGRPLFVVTNLDTEVARNRYLFPQESRPAQVPFHLHLSNASHGTSASPPGQGHLYLPLRKEQHVGAIISLLSREMKFQGAADRVRSLSGSLTLIQTLTTVLIERSVDVRQFDIRRVGVSAYHLDPQWRALLEGYWQCPVVELYGLSEIPLFTATRMTSTEPFVFSGPVLTEVLDLRSDQPVTDGVGRLVVTPLLPFASAQPLLRYDTGDVVDVTDFQWEKRSRTFTLLGRASSVVMDPIGRVILGRTEFVDLLCDLPDIAIQEYSDFGSVSLGSRFGWPRALARVENKGHYPTLEVLAELRYSPNLFPEAAGRVRKLLLSRLKRHARLSLEQREHGLQILAKVVAPGMLGSTLIATK